MTTETLDHSAAFSSERALRQHFGQLSPRATINTMGVAWQEAAPIAPELFYAQAARAISESYLGAEGMPHPDTALRAFFDLAYIWRACRNESQLRIRQPSRGFPQGDVYPLTGEPIAGMSSEHQNNLVGTRLELLFAAALCGARANGANMIARPSPGHIDYNGGSAAADLTLHTPDQNYALQIKSGGVGPKWLEYDLDSVVIVSSPLFVSYYDGRTVGHPEDRLLPVKAPLAIVAGMSESIAAGYTHDDFEPLLNEALERMQHFGDALLHYIADRPDRKVVEQFKQAQSLAQN